MGDRTKNTGNRTKTNANRTKNWADRTIFLLNRTKNVVVLLKKTLPPKVTVPSRFDPTSALYSREAARFLPLIAGRCKKAHCFGAALLTIGHEYLQPSKVVLKALPNLPSHRA